VKISPSFGSLQNLAKNLSLPKDNKLKSIPKTKESETKSTKSGSKNYHYSLKSDKYKEMLKDQLNLNKLNEIKKNIVTNTKISKKRQFGNEILALFKYNPKIENNINNKNGFDLNLFERKKYNSPNNIFSQSSRLIHAGEKAITVNQNRINNFTGTNAINNSLTRQARKNYNFRYDGNGNLLRSKNTRNFNNFNNYSFSRDDSMSKSNSKIKITNTSSLENEVQKKVKTILKKDFIGRYKEVLI
jgi:hypothetical protein